MNISSVDLNLLVVFEALLEQRNVTRAAKQVGLSQPAVSNALARLRDLLGDRLFTRTAHGMQPTARAAQLAGPVRSALAQLRGALAGPPGFDPSTSARSFRLAAMDYAEMLLLGGLLRRIHTAAPGVQIFVRRLERLFLPPEEDLRAGTIDAAIGFFAGASAVEPGTHMHDLMEEPNVLMARRGHPLLRGQLRVEQFAAAAQIGVFYRLESRGLIDNVLAGAGLGRTLQSTSPHFLTVPYAVAESDLIACVPAGLARRFQKILPLGTRKLPVAVPPFHLRLAWHERASDDPAQQWFRKLIVETAASARGRPLKSGG
jgi:DNA-binding transcriptional LysR family regulator